MLQATLPLLWAFITESSTMLLIICYSLLFMVKEEDLAILIKVSKRILFPSWMNWPRECKSLVFIVDIGKMPLEFLPSVSANNCFSHSVKAERLSS